MAAVWWPAPAEVLAASISPMMLTLPVAGRGTFRLENNEAATLTVEASVVRRSVDVRGEQTLAPADDEFIVFPPLAAVPPGGTQVFQVQYVAGVSLPASRSYYVTVRQLPVDVEPVAVGDGGQLTFLVAFNVAVHIVPQGAVPELQVTRVEPAGEAVAVTFENAGNRYVYLRDADVTVRADGQEVALGDAGHDILIDQNVLEPGKRRRVVLPLPADVRADDLEVDVSLGGTYR